jgi:hypothetical protein
MITKEHLKEEIEQLDEHYLELVFRLLQQFSHHKKSGKNRTRYSVHALSIMQHQKQQMRRYLQKLKMLPPMENS